MVNFAVGLCLSLINNCPCSVFPNINNIIFPKQGLTNLSPVLFLLSTNNHGKLPELFIITDTATSIAQEK